MADLYTTLHHAKLALLRGRPYSMTPANPEAERFLDPEFCVKTQDGKIGAGGLIHDANRGLRCPVLGCGEYKHVLSRHLTERHADIGGTATIRRLLDIPKTAPLISEANRGMRRSTNAQRGKGLSPEHAMRLRAGRGSANTPEHKRAISEGRKSTGVRNLKRRCPKQIVDRIHDLYQHLRRTPTAEEAQSLDSGLRSAAISVYGTWNNALGHAKLPVNKTINCITLEDILAGLYAWYADHGDLPRQADMTGFRLPRIHGTHVTLRAFGTSSWRHAMEQAASLLNIYGGRYGLPEKKTARPRQHARSS
jgi:hypothetical protein